MSKYAVGDKIITSSGNIGDVSSVRSKKITITWKNGLSAEYTPKQLQAWNYRKFLEEKECSHNLTSAQESARDSALLGCNSDLNLSESQKLTNTAVISSPSDTQAYTTTATCEICQDSQNADLPPIESICLQLPHPAPHSPQKVNDLEGQMSETVSPQSSKSLKNCNLNSQPLKTSQDLSPVLTTQGNQQAHISEAWSEPLTVSGTMRNGLLSAVDTLPVPSLESEYCWLRSPGALSSTGKGRPPGQTKQEAELKKLGLLSKGEVLNPAILCEWYRIPQTWLDPSESRAATELLEVNAQQQEIFSILAWRPLPCSESFTSTLCVDNQQLQKFKVGDRVVWRNAPNAIYEVATPEKGGHVIIKLLECSTKPLPFARKRVPLWEISFIECTQQLQENNQSLDNLIGDRQESNLAEKNLSQPTPENFLEENECTSFPAQQAKPSKQKGCLYKYLENKKLKSGDIVSYPRVIGHRDIDNPNHWRWGFNWEEKVSGEWKGRSIGSIPVGAIPMIQSMQKEGVPLEEIIGFIKRAKAKFNQHN